MLRRLSRFLWPAGCAVLIAAFVAMVARFYHPVYGFTSLLQFDATNEATMLPEVRDRPVFIDHRQGGYDGLYYAQLACHPSLRDPALGPAMDGNLVYRARRILVSGLAWALALGNPAWAIDIYSLVNPVCWLALAGLLQFLIGFLGKVRRANLGIAHRRHPVAANGAAQRVVARDAAQPKGQRNQRKKRQSEPYAHFRMN